jgi:hypothetical protein
VAKPPPAWDEKRTNPTENAIAIVILFCFVMIVSSCCLDLAGKQKNRLSCPMAEETEKNRSAVPLFLFPTMGITLRDTNISLSCNGNTRLHLLCTFGTAALQPVHRFCCFVSRTNRHFSERTSATTTLRPCVYESCYSMQKTTCQAKCIHCG